VSPRTFQMAILYRRLKSYHSALYFPSLAQSRDYPLIVAYPVPLIESRAQ